MLHRLLPGYDGKSKVKLLSVPAVVAPFGDEWLIHGDVLRMSEDTAAAQVNPNLGLALIRLLLAAETRP